MNRQREKLQYSNEQFTNSLWSVSLFFFFSSFLLFVVDLFFFSFSQSVAFFLCFRVSFVLFRSCFWYRPLPWSSRFKLRFKNMWCGHELALGTKSYYVVYRNTTTSRNIIKHNDDFNERTNTLLYKKYISHTLFSIGWCFCWVWKMSWRQGQTAILTPSFSSTIAALISHLGWLAQPWVTESTRPLVCKLVLTLASSLQLTKTAPGS